MNAPLHAPQAARALHPLHSARTAALSLGVSYEGRDPALLEQMLPHIDCIEVTPETMAEVRGGEVVLSREVLAELKNIDKEVRIIVHGVSLSIGSHDGWAPTYLRLLDDLLGQVRVAWHSEHLGYTKVGGEHLGIMLAMPRSDEALELICERVSAIQARYGMPFLLENIVRVVPDAPGDYSDAAFLNAITRRTGCGLLLDVYNLECDEHNHGLDVAAFFDALDMSRVREVHVACGVVHNGLMLDVHSRLPRACTVELADEVLMRRATQAEVLVYEFMPEAIPGLGHRAIANALAQLRKRFID